MPLRTPPLSHAGREPGAPALVVAHRGSWGTAPQNSLAAFEQAVSDGADVVELDVRRTADRRLVVLHDPRARGRAVGKLDHAALRDRMRTGQAPELDDVLAFAAGRIGVDLELKEDGYVAEVMALVARHLAPAQYVVTSFLPSVLPQVRRVAPEARTGLLLASRRSARGLERRVRGAQVDFVAPHVTLARTSLLAWAARRELPAWVWTVNDPRALRTLLADPRVEAVITDRARDAVHEARRLGARRPAAA